MADESVRFAGKVDVWFYAIIVAIHVLLLAPLVMALADPTKEGTLITAIVTVACLALCDALVIPMCVRNYVEFDGDGNFLIVFGLQKMSFPVKKIRSARETSNPLASLAASFDRIEIKAGYDETMIAVKDKERFYEELQRRCPGVSIERKRRS